MLDFKQKIDYHSSMRDFYFKNIKINIIGIIPLFLICLLIPSLCLPFIWFDDEFSKKELVVDEEIISPLPVIEEIQAAPFPPASTITKTQKNVVPFSALNSGSANLLNPLDEIKEESEAQEEVGEIPSLPEVLPPTLTPEQNIVGFTYKFEPTEELWKKVRDEVEAPEREKKKERERIEEIIREKERRLKEELAKTESAEEEEYEQIRKRIIQEEKKRFEEAEQLKEQEFKELLEKKRKEKEVSKPEVDEKEKWFTEIKLDKLKKWFGGTETRSNKRFWLPKRLKDSTLDSQQSIEQSQSSESKTPNIEPRFPSGTDTEVTTIKIATSTESITPIGTTSVQNKKEKAINKWLSTIGQRIKQKIWLPKFLTNPIKKIEKSQEQEIEETKELDIGKLLDRQLPLGSTLAINGNKTIDLKTGGSSWGFGVDKSKKKNPPASMFASGFNIDQKLAVNLHGVVKEKIHVNVDYNDAVPNTPPKFSINYQGTKEEVLKNVKFGDVKLNIPGTRFITANKELFGIKGEAKVGRFTFCSVVSRSKGQRKKEEFTGQTTKKETIREERYYVKQQYYQLEKGIDLIGVYIDDRNPDNDNSNTLNGTITAEMVSDTGTITHTGGEYDLLKPVDNYTFNIETGVLTFKNNLNDNWVAGVLYKKDGKVYPDMAKEDAKSPEKILMIKPEGGNIFSPYELKNYYNLGQSNITPDTVIELEILDLSNKNYYDVNKNNKQDENELNYIRLFGLDNDPMDNKIDTKFIDYREGLLYFPDSTPFNLGTNSRVINPDDTLSIIYNPKEDAKPEEKHKYSLKWKFPIKKKGYPLNNNMNIIEGSEQVYVDETLLTRGIDYYINYEFGNITFEPHIKIVDNTRIRVEYEDIPFISQSQNSVFALSGKYEPNTNFSIGSTYFFEGAPKSTKIPKITASSGISHVFDVDAKLTLVPLMKKMLNLEKSPPLELNLNGEIASSFRDPNTFGMAMIDSMEGSKENRNVSMNEDSWQLGSLPFGSNRGFLYYRNNEGNGAPTYKEDRPGPYNKKENVKKEAEYEQQVEEQVLTLECDHLSRQGTETQGTKTYISIVNPISSVYQDYSDYTDLEILLKNGSLDNISELYIDIGIVSEVADSDPLGAMNLKSEDDNKNGIADGNEKNIGWRFNHSDGTWTMVGKDNDTFDSEDLDRDGSLRTEESYYSFPIKQLAIGGISAGYESQWQAYLIPLNKANKGAGSPDWTQIKHIRIRVEGTSTDNPTIAIGGLSFVKNSWRRGEFIGTGSYFNVSSLNSYDDPSYPSLKDDPIYKDYYEKIHGVDVKREETLVLSYSLPEQRIEGTTTITAQGWTSRVIGSTPHNYNNYKYLKFFLYNKVATNTTFFFRFGNDDNNYFAYNQGLDFSGWKLVEIDLDKIKEIMINKRGTSSYNVIQYPYEIKGNPFFDNIRQIKAGVLNKSNQPVEGQVYLNEIHVTDAKKVEGVAKRIELKSKFKDYLNVTVSNEQVDGYYESPSRTTANNDQKISDLAVGFSKLNFLPINYTWKKTLNEMDPIKGNNAINKELGYDETRYQKIDVTLKAVDLENAIFKKVTLKNATLTTTFLKRCIPDVTINSILTNNQIETRRSKKTDKKENTFSSTVNYKYIVNMPKRLPKQDTSTSTTSNGKTHGFAFTIQRLSKLIPTGQILVLTPEYRHTQGQVIDVNYENTNETGTDCTRSQGGDLNLDFTPYKWLSGFPKIKINQTKKKINKENRSQNDWIYLLTTRSINLSLDNISCSLVKKVTPRLDTKFDYTENYVGTNSLIRTKNLNSGSYVGLTLPLAPSQWFATQTKITRLGRVNLTRYLNSLDLKYTLNINANYENVPAQLDTYETIKRVYRDYHQGQIFNPMITINQDTQFDGTKTKRVFGENKRNYTINTQWNIFEPLTTSRLDYTYSRNETQDKDTIKSSINNSYNLILQLDLPKTFPRYKNFLSSSNINSNYTWTSAKDRKTNEITITKDFNPSLSWERRNATLTTTFKLTCGNKEVIKPKDLKDNTFTIIPNFHMKRIVSNPKPIKFLGKKITFERKLDTDTDITLNYTKREQDNKLQEHKASFAFDLSGSYNVQINTKGSLGGKIGYIKDLMVNDSDYWGYEFRIGVNFNF